MNEQPLMKQILSGMQRSKLPSDYWFSTQSNPEFPELDATKTIIGRGGESVFNHTMSVIDLLSVKNPITLLSGLFHDLGKSRVQSDTTSSRYRGKFPCHDIESAKIAKMVLKEWGASEYLIDRVVRVVVTHMYDITNALGEKTIRNFVAEVGQDNISNWFVLRVADSQSYTFHREYRNNIIEPFRVAVLSYVNQQPNIGQPKLTLSDTQGSMQIEGGDV